MKTQKFNENYRHCPNAHKFVFRLINIVLCENFYIIPANMPRGQLLTIWNLECHSKPKHDKVKSDVYPNDLFGSQAGQRVGRNSHLGYSIVEIGVLKYFQILFLMHLT